MLASSATRHAAAQQQHRHSSQTEEEEAERRRRKKKEAKQEREREREGSAKREQPERGEGRQLGERMGGVSCSWCTVPRRGDTAHLFVVLCGFSSGKTCCREVRTGVSSAAVCCGTPNGRARDVAKF